MSVESPAYEVIERDGRFELRRYAGYITADVHVRADDPAAASNVGFNPLANYIFGDNRARDRIAMTAPVTAERAAGRRIAMTAPVTARPAEGERIAMTAPLTATRVSGDYIVSFTMPSSYSMDELPLPNDAAVTLHEVGPHTAAVVRFSGYMSRKAAAREEAELAAWMAARGLVAVGEPVLAQYDAPWKLGFARRNEIIARVQEPEA
jgi:hypothetical protein